MNKQMAAIVLATVLLAPQLARADDMGMAKATTGGNDFTGLWWVPAENGWGANVIQQGRILFVTLFVYGTDNRPQWLVGSGITNTGTDSSGALVFTGPLYQTTGPAFNGVYNPANFGFTQVGTLTFRASTTIAAQLSYTVNGVTVNKNVVPQTFQPNDLTGTYIGAMFGANATCNLPTAQTAGALMTFTVRQTGSSFSMDVVATTANRCTLTGTVTQYGKQGLVTGTYTCSNNTSGQFSLGQLEAGLWGLTGFYVSASVANCAASAAALGAARVN